MQPLTLKSDLNCPGKQGTKTGSLIFSSPAIKRNELVTSELRFSGRTRSYWVKEWLQLVTCWFPWAVSDRLSSMSCVSDHPGSYVSRKPILALLGRSWGWTKGTPCGHPISLFIFAQGLFITLWLFSHSLRLQNLSLIPFLSAISWTRSLRTLCASNLSRFDGGSGLHLESLFLRFFSCFIDPVP